MTCAIELAIVTQAAFFTFFASSARVDRDIVLNHSLFNRVVIVIFHHNCKNLVNNRESLACAKLPKGLKWNCHNIVSEVLRRLTCFNGFI